MLARAENKGRVHGQYIRALPAKILPRILPAVILGVIFASLAFAYLSGHRWFYMNLLWGYGITPFPTPFIDISGSLAAWDCTRLGLDVVLRDPCDLLQRGYNYSPLWMAAAAIPLGTSQTGLVGLLLDAVFVGSLTLLPASEGRFQLMIRILATGSTMVVFALERANPDLLIFAMIVIVWILFTRSEPSRIAAYGCAFIAGLIKYYPFALGLLLFRERPLRFFSLILLASLLLGAFGCIYYADIMRGLPLIASGNYYSDLFGAQNLPCQLAEFVIFLADLPMLLRPAVIGIYAVAFFCCILHSRSLVQASAFRAALRHLPQPEKDLLTIGSILIIGCFFAGQNVGYRGVLLLLVLPGLAAMCSNPDGSTSTRLFRSASIVIVVLMWEEFLRRWSYELSVQAGLQGTLKYCCFAAFWLLRELSWWWLVSILMATLGLFMLESPIARRAKGNRE